MMRLPDAVVALCASFSDSAAHARLARTSKRFRRVTETASALPACVTVRSLYHVRGTEEVKLLERLHQTTWLQVHVTNAAPPAHVATNWTTGGAAAMMTILLRACETRLRRLTIVVADDDTPRKHDRVLNSINSGGWNFSACTRFEVCVGVESRWRFDAMQRCMPNVTEPVFCDGIVDRARDPIDTRNREATSFVCSSHLERASAAQPTFSIARLLPPPVG